MAWLLSTAETRRFAVWMESLDPGILLLEVVPTPWAAGSLGGSWLRRPVGV